MALTARFAPALIALATVFATGCNQVELDDVDYDHMSADAGDETGDESVGGDDDGYDEDSDSGADDGYAFQDEHGALPVCGDGELNEGEECDEGDGNDDNGACTSQCAINVCGDGLVYEGVEDCEGEGPMADGGYCTAECTAVYPE